jgi:hypothetical protein
MTGIYIPDTWEEEQELARPSKPHASPEVGKLPYRRTAPKVDATPDVGKVRSVAELREDRQPTIWTIDQFGARGNAVMLAAETGLGKTTFMYRAAEAIANGCPLMDQLPTVKGRVLFIQGDESRQNAANKLKAMEMEAEGIDFLFPDEQGWNGLEMDRLKVQIRSQSYAAVFLDSTTTLLTHGRHSMKDAEFSHPLYELNALASRNNLLVVISAHLRKPESGINRSQVTVHDINGTGTQSGAVSDIWGIWRPAQPTHEHHYVLGCLGKRNCKEGIRWHLQGNREDYSWTLKDVGDGDLLPIERQQLRAELLGHLAANPSPRAPKDLAEALGYNAEHVRRVCFDLFLEETISREKQPTAKGRPAYLYSLPVQSSFA